MKNKQMKKKLGRPAKYKTEEERRNAQTVSSSRSRSKRLLNMPPAERAEYNKKQSEYSKQWRNKNLERAKAYAYKNNNPTELYSMCRFVIKQAARRSDICTITDDELAHIFYSQDGKCAISGDKLTMGKSNCIFKMSPDQIVPGLGYTKENIQLLTVQANRAKFKNTTKQTVLFGVSVAKNHMIHHMTEKQITDFFCDILKQKHKLS